MAKKNKETAPSTIVAASGGAPVPHRRLKIADCEPNDWNMNVVPPDVREKLQYGIEKMLEATGGVLPDPIVVRPHPTATTAKWQIIDGYHRWDILRALGHEEVDAWVIDVSTKNAMILTDTLNYLRGDQDNEKKADYLRRLIVENHMTVPEVAEFLPETVDEIQRYLDAYDIKIEHLDIPEDEGDKGDDTAGDPFMELKFVMSRSQAEVVEREVTRISSILNGKNMRGRALEFMAVNSSQKPMESILGVVSNTHEDDSDAPLASLLKIKKKLREKAV